MGLSDTAPPADTCPLPEHHYCAESLNSAAPADLAAHLNEMYARGYKLAHVWQFGSRTVQVFEHHFHG